MYQRYWGQALQLVRGLFGLSQVQVLTELNRRTGRGISPEQFDSMEKDSEDIDPSLFEVWCDLFPGGKIKILKYAQFMHDNAHRPDKELLEEALQEVEYQLWKRRQTDT